MSEQDEGENACARVGFPRRRGGSSTKPRFEGFGHSARGGVFGWLGTPSRIRLDEQITPTCDNGHKALCPLSRHV